MTQAGVYVFNELPGQLNTSVDSNNTQDMDDDGFLNASIPVNGNIYGVIDAGDWPEQSIIQVDFSASGFGGWAKLNLGEGAYNTQIDSYGTQGQVGVQIAPLPTTDPTVPGYYFYFLCANGVITNFVNSLLQANLAALVNAYISSNPPAVPGLGLTITSINTGNLNCNYAGLSSMGGNTLAFSMIAESNILSASGTCNGSNASITLNGLSVLLQGTITIPDSGAMSVVVTNLKCSLTGFELVNLSVDVLNYITNATDVAGIINDTNVYPLNAFILKEINAAIASALKNMTGNTSTLTQKLKEYAN